MGYFEDIQNPWSPGGQMSPRMPWAQPGLNYGWGHGNEFFHPKTKEQIQEEALMQLAVLAVVLVAPALVGAGGGAGAGGSLGSGAGTAGGSLGSGGGIGGSVGAGMGTSAEAAGGMLTQAEAVSGLVDSTLMAAPMVPAAGAGAGAGAAAASGGGGALAGVLGAMQALQPFLQGDSARVLRSAAQKGPEHLNQELKRRTKDCDCPPKPKFVTEEWLRLHGDCGCDDKQGSDHEGLSSRDGRPHEGMEVLQGVMHLLRKDVGVSQALRQVDHCCSKPLSLDTQQKLRKTIGESLPRRSGVKALEGVMDRQQNWQPQNAFEDKLLQECIGISFLTLKTPFVKRYYDTNVLHFYYFQPSYKNPGEFFGHFAIGVQAREMPEVLYYPAHGDFAKAKSDKPFDKVENPISEPDTIQMYLDHGRHVARFSMRIEDRRIFQYLRQTILEDPMGTGSLGDATVCVGAANDILNWSYLNVFKPDSDFSDPETLLGQSNDYIEYFPFAGEGANFPREYWLAATREPNLFGIWDVSWDCPRLKADKIFEVLYFIPE